MPGPLTTPGKITIVLLLQFFPVEGEKWRGTHKIITMFSRETQALQSHVMLNILSIRALKRNF